MEEDGSAPQVFRRRSFLPVRQIAGSASFATADRVAAGQRWMASALVSSSQARDNWDKTAAVLSIARPATEDDETASDVVQWPEKVGFGQQLIHRQCKPDTEPQLLLCPPN